MEWKLAPCCVYDEQQTSLSTIFGRRAKVSVHIGLTFFPRNLNKKLFTQHSFLLIESEYAPYYYRTFFLLCRWIVEAMRCRQQECIEQLPVPDRRGPKTFYAYGSVNVRLLILLLYTSLSLSFPPSAIQYTECNACSFSLKERENRIPFYFSSNSVAGDTSWHWLDDLSFVL